MIDFVVGLVKERADSGGSRFSESSLERCAVLLFHCGMRYAWNVEVNVPLVDCTIELVVRVEWRNFTMFVRSMLFFHCPCTWAVKLPWSIVSLFNTGIFRQIIKLHWSITDWFWDWLGKLGERCVLNFSSRLRTTLPSGCDQLIVEPNWTFPLVQSWSCWNEIFGGGRGMIAFDRVW